MLTDNELIFTGSESAHKAELLLQEFWNRPTPPTRAEAEELCELARTLNCCAQELVNRVRNGAVKPEQTESTEKR